MPKEITTLHLILRTPQNGDSIALELFERRNKEHLAQWESLESPLSTYLDNWIKECEEGKSARFFIFSKKSPEIIIGMCNFTQIFRGAFQACYLGYKIDHEYEGQGLMFEALQNLITYVFEELNLHRIMANYMPSNKRSAKLLERLGFVIEGKAKKYLLINNNWEDHVLTSLTNDQWEKNRSLK